MASRAAARRLDNRLRPNSARKAARIRRRIAAQGALEAREFSLQCRPRRTARGNILGGVPRADWDVDRERLQRRGRLPQHKQLECFDEILLGREGREQASPTPRRPRAGPSVEAPQLFACAMGIWGAGGRYRRQEAIEVIASFVRARYVAKKAPPARR